MREMFLQLLIASIPSRILRSMMETSEILQLESDATVRKTQD
jgi:hypothetical protein